MYKWYVGHISTRIKYFVTDKLCNNFVSRKEKPDAEINKIWKTEYKGFHLFWLLLSDFYVAPSWYNSRVLVTLKKQQSNALHATL